MSDPLASFSMRGSRVWVTGASRGLGRGIARGMLQAGARVAVTARSAEALQRLREEFSGANVDVLALPGSVARESDVSTMAETIASSWGGLDVLVNCAGISPTMPRSERADPSEFRDVLNVNLTGTFLCAQAAARLMLPNGSGSIINISSVHGSVGMSRLAAYSASKGAVDALTKSLALEWASAGVRVNAVCPGYFATDMTEGLRSHEALSERLLNQIPLGRFGEDDDLVPAVVFLASSASRYVTGSCLFVDGGWTAA